MQKKFAFKQQKHNPAKPQGVPDEWVWLRAEISEGESEQYTSDNWVVLDTDDFDSYLRNGNQNFNLHIFDFVDSAFKNLHPSKIDFRRHLKSDVYLQKNVTMAPNGRPLKATYSQGSIVVAEIEFRFQVTSMNFMARRTELLCYFKKDGSPSDQWVIADDIYDMQNPYHLREVMKERSEARANIIEEVKAFLNGVLAQFYLPQGKTYPEILNIAGQFWDKYSTPIDSWINVGAPQFKDMLTADTEFPFLSVPISQTETVRQYILNKTSY